MKKLAIVLSLAVLTAAPSLAAGIGVGLAHWDTDTADEDQGFGVRVGVGLGESVDFEIRASFFDELNQVANNALFRLEALPVDLGLAWRFNPDGKAQPYIGAGGTYIYTDVLFEGGANPLAGGPEVDDEFGYYFVVGVDGAMTEMFGFYAEALYRQAKLNVTFNDFGFTDFESDFAGVGAGVGVMLRW